MKKWLYLFIPVYLLIITAGPSLADNPETDTTVQTEQTDNHESHSESHDDASGHGEESEHGDGHHEETMPQTWSVIPFVLLLLMIATGPLFFEHFWHKNYPVIAVTLAAIVILYYIFGLENTGHPIHATAEYIQFIALLASLFMASGGILIRVDKEGKPLTNVALLLIGAVIANVIGTTGASMLLIRPFIRLNKNRVKAYHIVFFIFIVSNVGGSLTPIGDPPLFLGFLKGVPFEWTITHNFVPWLFAITILSLMFYFVDKRNKADFDGPEVQEEYSGKISITGAANFGWLAVIIASVFIDPNIFDWVPGIPFHGTKLSFIREAIMLSVAGFSYYFANQEALKGNEFEFEPIKEVAFIFIGIFGTMMPALQLVSEFASSEEGKALISYNSLYWGTGSLSGVLDNAPTYMNFLAAAISAHGGNINVLADVRDFAAGTGTFANAPSIIELTAISVASVFFGAMTYIGNGPNFMVKAIAEQVGITMPSFFGYIIRYSFIYLLPLLFIVWLLFFQFELIKLFIS